MKQQSSSPAPIKPKEERAKADNLAPIKPKKKRAKADTLDNLERSTQNWSEDKKDEVKQLPVKSNDSKTNGNSDLPQTQKAEWAKADFLPKLESSEEDSTEDEEEIDKVELIAQKAYPLDPLPVDTKVVIGTLNREKKLLGTFYHDLLGISMGDLQRKIDDACGPTRSKDSILPKVRIPKNDKSNIHFRALLLEDKQSVMRKTKELITKYSREYKNDRIVVYSIRATDDPEHNMVEELKQYCLDSKFTKVSFMCEQNSKKKSFAAQSELSNQTKVMTRSQARANPVQTAISTLTGAATTKRKADKTDKAKPVLVIKRKKTNSPAASKDVSTRTQSRIDEDALQLLEDQNLMNEELSTVEKRLIIEILEKRLRNLQRLQQREKARYWELLKCEPMDFPDISEEAITSCVFKIAEGIFRLIGSDGKNIDIPLLSTDEYTKQSGLLANAANNDDLETKLREKMKKKRRAFQEFRKKGYMYEKKFRMSHTLAKCPKCDLHCHCGGLVRISIIIQVIEEYLQKQDIIYVDEYGKGFTTRELFLHLGLPVSNLTEADIQIINNGTSSHHFSVFDKSFTNCGNKIASDALQAKDGPRRGAIFARMVKLEFEARLTEDTYSEIRVTLSGKSWDDLKKLAEFLNRNGLITEREMYTVQIPQVSHSLISFGYVKNFEEILKNIFGSLIKATLNPHHNPSVTKFMKRLSGIDLVGRESRSTIYNLLHHKPADIVDKNLDAGNSFWQFYGYNNTVVLNFARRVMGLEPLLFIPHSMEKGEMGHAMNSFLMNSRISHGKDLIKYPLFHYLAYVTQMPIVCSIASNEILFPSMNNEKHPYRE